MHARSCEMRRVGVRVRVPHCTMDARSHPRRARGRGRSGRRSRRRWRRRALRRTSWWGRCWANAARAGDGVPDEAAEGAGRVVVRRWLYMSALEEDAAMAAVEDQPRAVVEWDRAEEGGRSRGWDEPSKGCARRCSSTGIQFVQAS